MKTINLLLAIVTATTLNLKFGTLNCKAQTSVPAGNVSGTWTLAGSPYNIQGSIQILDGTALTIQPGVTINFQGTYKLNVQGRLLAIGTATDTIIFTATNTTNGWGGIRFDNTPFNNDTSNIYYCKLQYSNANGTSPNDLGGAFYFNGFSKANISNCRISNCSANMYGGGVYCTNSSSPKISYNIISYNSSSQSGGGIYCDNSSPTLNSNIISYNNAGMLDAGGGIYCANGTAIIINNIISNNTAFYGGGIQCSGGSQTITNNIICNNMASANGGGICCVDNSSPTILSSTIINNSAQGGGGALYCIGGSDPTLRNCILHGNTANYNGAQVSLTDDESDPNFYYCDVQGSSAAFALNGNSYTGAYENCADADPLFISPSTGTGSSFDGLSADWSLQLSSTCIDAGDPTTQTPLLDVIGNPRIRNCHIDKGAVEYQAGILLQLTIAQTSPIPCFGYTTGTLQAMASGNGSSYNYLWSNGQTTETAVSLGAGEYSVTVTVTGFVCSITKTITINQPATALSLIASLTNASCLENDGNASITANGGTAPYSYLWSNTSISQNLSNIGSGTYSVIATDTNGCVVSETLTINNSIAPISIPICMVTVDSSSTKNVIVWEKPTDAPIDSFRIYREVASVYTLVGIVPYEDVSEFTDNANGINPNTTSYKYKLSVLDTCGNESLLSTEHHTIHLQLSLAFPQGVNLNWNDYVGFSFSQYRILRDDLGNGNWQAIDSVSFGTTTYTSPDVLPNAQYIVEATRPTSCVSTRQIGTTRNSSKSNAALKQTIGVNELLSDLTLIISPNPSNGKFNIELSNPGFSNKNKYVIKIYNVLGEQIYFSDLKPLTHNEIDLSNAPKGIYFVNVFSEVKIYTRKIVKQ